YHSSGWVGSTRTVVPYARGAASAASGRRPPPPPPTAPRVNICSACPFLARFGHAEQIFTRGAAQNSPEQPGSAQSSTETRQIRRGARRAAAGSAAESRFTHRDVDP